MINLDKYLSVTWQMGGRAYPILDCYGLVHEVRRDLGLPEWPLFEGVIKESDRMHKAFLTMLQNTTLCLPKEGAVAACYTGGLVGHVGIVINGTAGLQVIEVGSRTGVTILPLSRFERRHQNVEYYW